MIVAGSGFVPGVTAYFGAQESTSVTVMPGGTGLYALVPSATAGAVDITATTTRGRPPPALKDAYFYGTPVVTA